MSTVEAAPGRAPSRALVLLTAGCVALYAAGLGPRPAGLAWDRLFDVVLFNATYLPAAATAWLAGLRIRPERTAWRAMALTLVLFAVANADRTLAQGMTGRGNAPALGNVLAPVGYLLIYVTMVGLIRTRVRRFHRSMWLDGLVGALGTTALGLAFLIGPFLHRTARHDAVHLIDLTWPLGDVLLLALLVAVGAMLRVRIDASFAVLGAALVCVLAGDVQLFVRTVDGTYVDGGPLDLCYLAGIVLVAVAAHLACRRGAPPTPDGAGDRPGLRLLALPLVCAVASLVVLAVGWNGRIPAAAAWLAVGCVVAALARTVVTFREVQALHEVRAQARTDELTGLPNRRALLEESHRVLAAASAQRPAALLLLDLDGFKEVNDGLGHHAGDQLLRQIGPRLRGGLPRGAVLARLGGDEFAILLSDAGLDEAQECAEVLLALLRDPFLVEDIRLHVGASIGVATAPVPAATVEELLRCSDVAMYAAKAGREGVRAYVPDPQGGTGDRLRTMEELRTALVEGQLEIHLQPQYHLQLREVVGAEALVRWRHPVRGLLSPADLLPAAEQAGLLGPLTDEVLEQSLRATAGWWRHRRVPVSVNLSAANVTDIDLPAKVAAALERHGLPAAALTLELVEDTLMTDPDRGRTVLGELRRLGVRTSIDDYGTGYSSLAYLRGLPADELKLDRSLTADVATDPRAAAIVRHTVALAHDLGLVLVAEGVEDDETGAALAAFGCDLAQGYAIARPMPVADFVAWLARPVEFLSRTAPAT